LQLVYVRLRLRRIGRLIARLIDLPLELVDVLLVAELLDLLVAPDFVELLLLPELILSLLDVGERIDRRRRRAGAQQRTQTDGDNY